ncbi:uncharacterized protein LOC134550478 isoform X5 [Prinia subflava]|uniref:uncharacterized protein LOC134550478 isoform X5 n=1 Tax=Prinia subflava TaxID=208062 RepID=UPI002FDF13B6
MAAAQERPPGLSDAQVLVLAGVTVPAALLSLLGSGSVLAVTSWQGRCCHIQLRPLFLLALADLLGAAALLGTGTIPLLPAPLSVPAYAACPYGRMLTATAYAVSLLMVVVYAYESHRTVLGGRARPPAALQERSRCLESAWRGIPYALAWLLPALTLLARLLVRGAPATDIAPVGPWDGRGSNATFGLYCSSPAGVRTRRWRRKSPSCCACCWCSAAARSCTGGCGSAAGEARRCRCWAWTGTAASGPGAAAASAEPRCTSSSSSCSAGRQPSSSPSSPSPASALPHSLSSTCPQP